MNDNTMTKLFLIIIITLLIFLFSFSCNSTTSVSPQISNESSNLVKEERKSFSPRELLINQPDFQAEEIFSEFESRGGFSNVSKIAKKGEYYRLELEGSVAFIKINQSLMRYDEIENKFTNIPGFDQNKWYQNINYTAIFANQENIEFSEIGTEFLFEHNCLKIEAKPKGKEFRNNKETAIFYVANDLNNLVIAIKINLRDRTKHYVLRDISFDVPDKLFTPVETYKP